MLLAASQCKGIGKGTLFMGLADLKVNCLQSENGAAYRLFVYFTNPSPQHFLYLVSVVREAL